MMNIVQKGLAAAGFVVAAGTGAFAGEGLQTSDMKAVSVSGGEDQNYQTYYLEELVMSDRTTVRGRAFVDKVIGVTCEWTEHGRRVADENARFHTVDVQSRQIGCVRTTEKPAKWHIEKKAAAAEGMDISGFAIMGGLMMQMVDPEARKQYMEQAIGDVRQNPVKLNELKELIDGSNPHAVERMRIMHSWDISANKVCLQTLEVPSEDRAAATRPMNWGCFEIKDTGYFDRILKSAGVHPA